jgi:phytoene dehydrogenase-like protein
VHVIEGGSTIGGGARTAELTLPGFNHDICSTIHPLAVSSPFFSSVPLSDYGLKFVQPPASLAHPLDDGTVMLLKRSLEETGETLGVDNRNYRKVLERFVRRWSDLAPEIFGPISPLPRHPFLLADFGFKTLRSTTGFVKKYFDGPLAAAIFAGCAAHSMIPLEDVPSAAFGMVLAITAHTAGWAIPVGGSQSIADAMAAHLESLGGTFELNHTVTNIDELPPSKAIVFDLTPRQILSIASHRLSSGYRRRLEKFQYGAGAFKMDFALSEPIPWKQKECALAGTVHLGGTISEIAESERVYQHGRVADRPFVLMVQTSLFDPTRAPEGKHTAWAYIHVANGCTEDLTERLENQVERFAPGFRDCILAKNVMSPTALEAHNPNNVGGDIGGGANTLAQTFTRPVLSTDPYPMGNGLYICSSSTPPGGGVHGMCGYHAAQSLLRNEF